MDIQIASNFERLIYDLNDFDDIETKDVMIKIKNQLIFQYPQEILVMYMLVTYQKRWVFQ